MKAFEKKQIPNILSVIRLLMVPAFAVIFFADFGYHKAVALTIFIVAELTDVLDGFLARKFGWITDAGKILDPMADKLMQLTAFVCIAIKVKAAIFLASLICVKDIMMLIGGIVLAKKGAKDLVVSKWFGKLASLILAVTLGLFMLLYSNKTAVWLLTVISAATIIFALLMYLFCVFLKFIRPDKK